MMSQNLHGSFSVSCWLSTLVHHLPYPLILLQCWSQNHSPFVMQQFLCWQSWQLFIKQSLKYYTVIGVFQFPIINTTFIRLNTAAYLLVEYSLSSQTQSCIPLGIEAYHCSSLVQSSSSDHSSEGNPPVVMSLCTWYPTTLIMAEYESAREMLGKIRSL